MTDEEGVNDAMGVAVAVGCLCLVGAVWEAMDMSNTSDAWVGVPSKVESVAPVPFEEGAGETVGNPPRPRWFLKYDGRGSGKMF